jgi:3-oxoacyl-[acyl-carrier-protein] synthase-3
MAAETRFTEENMAKATIVGTGLYAPENVVKNEYFDKLFKKDISTFLKEQRGISERRWMDPSQRTSDLIIPAAEEAMNNAGIEASDLDLIIVATDTPDYLSPSTASVVQYRLGAKNAGTFDINSACAGFVTACDTASKFITADNQYQNILVVGAYAMSKFLDRDDYKTTSLFADGAGAAVLQPSDSQYGFLASTMYTDGQYHDYMGIYSGGSAEPASHDAIENKRNLLAFPKRVPPETNGIHWPRLTHKLLEQIKKTPQDVKHFFVTQFNIQSIYETMDKLNLPRERAHYIMNNYGYTGSASIGMCIADAANSHKIKKGDLCILLGSGGGMSMSAIALEWSYDT